MSLKSGQEWSVIIHANQVSLTSVHRWIQGPEGRERRIGECQSSVTGYSTASHCIPAPLTCQLFSLIFIQNLFFKHPGPLLIMHLEWVCTLFIYLWECVCVCVCVCSCACVRACVSGAYGSCWLSIRVADWLLCCLLCSSGVCVWCLFRARSLIWALCLSLLSTGTACQLGRSSWVQGERFKKVLVKDNEDVTF